jgi:stearoyl-CoA desaturase (delta-9 desaturase)
MTTPSASLPAIPGSVQLTGTAAFKNRLIASLAIGIPTLSALVGLGGVCTGHLHPTWSDLGISAFMYTITGLGVTVGMHRLFTHRSFEATKATQTALGILGIMALQGDIKGWVATHRRHHRYSDEYGDPHSPKGRHQGQAGAWSAVFFTHFSRLFLAEDTLPSVYAPDLCRNPLVQKIDRWAPLWIALTLAVPALLGFLLEGSARGAWSGLFWGGPVRIFVGQNIASCVNSLCHMFGQTPFKTTDESKNNLFVGIMAFGEGWHNNHHAFPNSAKQGLFRGQLDLSYALIAALEKLGLAWEVKVPTHAMIEKKKQSESKAVAPLAASFSDAPSHAPSPAPAYEEFPPPFQVEFDVETESRV